MAYTKLVFSGRDFAITGLPDVFFPGSEVIAAYELPDSLNPFHELGILFGFIFAIRILHFVLLSVHVYPYVSHRFEWPNWSSLVAFGKKQPSQQTQRQSQQQSQLQPSRTISA